MVPDLLLPRIAPLIRIALLFTIAAMFSLKGGMVVDVPLEALFIAADHLLRPDVLHRLRHGQKGGAGYPRTITMSFTVASNNFELAIADSDKG